MHFGQTNPDMFSITPLTLILSFEQKFNSFLTSDKATSYGVVTIIASNSGRSFSYNNLVHD